jgi:hypothetical protein
MTTLDHITDAICDTNTALAVYDSLTEARAARQATVEALASDLESLRINAGDLEPKVRISKHVSASSDLALAEADLKSESDALFWSKRPKR